MPDSTNYRAPSRPLSKRALEEDSPPPWPLSRDPRTAQCTHDWDGKWGEVGERQYQCKHCDRYIWQHAIDDPEIPPWP